MIDLSETISVAVSVYLFCTISFWFRMMKFEGKFCYCFLSTFLYLLEFCFLIEVIGNIEYYYTKGGRYTYYKIILEVNKL